MDLGLQIAGRIFVGFGCLFAMTACGTIDVAGPSVPPPHYPAPSEGTVIMTPVGLPTELHIPAGHLPPPGACRIWYPERPAGQQPPPGDCAELARRVPPGAWLLSRPSDDREHVHVAVFDPEQPSVEIAVRVFNSTSGRFVRDLRRPLRRE